MAFIIKPLITEKMTNITEKSSVDRTYKPKTGKHRGEEVTKKAQPKYGFIVKPQANKIEIAKACEEVFKVKVAKVNTLNVRGQFRRQGRNNGGYTRSWKKAIITLAANSKPIEFFEGMM